QGDHQGARRDAPGGYRARARRHDHAYDAGRERHARQDRSDRHRVRVRAALGVSVKERSRRAVRPHPTRPIDYRVTLMKTAPTLLPIARAGLLLAPLVGALGGCASRAYKTRDADLKQLRQGPGNAPQRNVTDFSNALRCMDDTLVAFGTRDIVIVVE